MPINSNLSAEPADYGTPIPLQGQNRTLAGRPQTCPCLRDRSQYATPVRHAINLPLFGPLADPAAIVEIGQAADENG